MDNEKKAYFPISIWSNRNKPGKKCYRMIEAYNFEVFKQIYSDKIGNDIINNSIYNFSSNRYRGEIDNRGISDTSKVIVYKDTANKLIGIVTGHPSVRIWWVPEKAVREDLNNQFILNSGFVGLVEVDKDFEFNYKSNSPFVHRSEKLKFNFNKKLSVHEFNKIAGIEGNEAEPEISEQTEDEIKQDLMNEIIVHEENGLRAVISEVVDRELSLDKMDLDLAYREQELNEREREIQLREYNMTKAELISDNETITDAEIIYDPMEVMSVKSDSIEKSTYDFIFKVLKKGDTISVPFNIFSQFVLVAKSGALERNVDYTRYLQIMFIKLDRTQKVGLTAMVNVNNEDDVKVTVLEEYGNNTVTNTKIFEYENNYRQWKRDRSFVS